MDMSTESMRMPRYVRAVAGLSVLSAASGTPSSAMPALVPARSRAQSCSVRFAMKVSSA